MIIKVRHNPRTTGEYSEFTGFQINGTTTHDDGSMEFDLEKDTLTTGERKTLLSKLSEAQSHLVEF